MQPPELDQVLSIKPSIRVEAVDSESLFLIGERERFAFADPRVVRIASLIDGKRPVHEILSQASPEVSEAQTLYILGHLTERGHVIEAAPGLPAQSAAFWDGVGLDPRTVADRLKRVSVGVRSFGNPTLGEWMSDSLQQTGFQLDDGATTQLVVTDDCLRPEIASVSAEARRRGAQWFLVQPVGTRPLVGPLFRPKTGPCWECLAFWMRNNRPVEELVRRRNGGTRVTAPAGVVEVSARTAMGLAALVLARELASSGDPSQSMERSQILALDLISFQTTTHAVVKRPQCPACGDPGFVATRAHQPVELQPVLKRHCSDGGYRRSTPEETWERYRHLVSPISGPIAYVEPVPGRNNDLRAVFASGYLICPRSSEGRGNSFDKVCAGKGRSAAQARTSALCEAIERYSGVWQGDEARIRATSSELGSRAVSLSALTNFSDTQYRDATHITEGAASRRLAPPRLDGDVAIDWTPAWSLSRGERRYVPASYCYAETPEESGAAYFDPCGNGAAAGTCIEEAVLQGLLELVERDAVAIWWYNRIRRPGVDLESFGDPYFPALRAEYARLGWELWALDLTHDLGIPSFAALAHNRGEDRFAIGFGSHLDAHLSLQRALTEVNQLFDPAAARRAALGPRSRF